MVEMEVLPYKHDAVDLSEAIGIPVDEVKRVIENPSEFSSLSDEKRLRIAAVTSDVFLRMFTDKAPAVVGLLLTLSTGFDRYAKRSEVIEFIERRLLEYVNERGLPLDKFFKQLSYALLCLTSSGFTGIALLKMEEDGYDERRS